MTITIKDLGNEFKITATREVLNSLCRALDNSREYNKLKGYDSLAEENDIWSMQIYTALKNSGFYENL